MLILKTSRQFSWSLSGKQPSDPGRTIVSESNQLFADVALDTSARELSERIFTYLVPPGLQDEVSIGSQVLVPFGKQDYLSGYIANLNNDPPAAHNHNINYKHILEVLDEEPIFDRHYMDYLRWIANYYACSLSDVIAAAIPSQINPRIRRLVKLMTAADAPEKTGARDRLESILDLNRLDPEQDRIIQVLKNATDKQLSLKALKQRCQLPQNRFYAALNRLKLSGVIVLAQETEEAGTAKVQKLVIWTGNRAETPRQQQIIDHLQKHDGKRLLSQLLEEAATTSGTITRMVTAGILQITAVEIVRDPLKNIKAENILIPHSPPLLTEDQRACLAILSKELAARQALEPQDDSEPWLLHGVTGSGKTEIYLQLTAATLQAGRSALIMVPEISLTPQLSQRFVERFGSQVAVWHSGLSVGERFDTWQSIRQGTVRVLLGARSAILTNLPDLGLIVLDEEHDASYKQSSPAPRYNAKELARERGRRANCLVIFGSATPDLCTLVKAKQCQKVVSLPKRVFNQPMPKSIVVDMRNEFREGNKSSFSRRLQQNIADKLSLGEQTVLLINRRGYASHVFCRSCGEVVRCRYCSVSLVYHHKESPAGSKTHDYLCCHHCGYRQATSDTCPACLSPFLRHAGLGIQKIEQETQELFPQARVLRIDSDIAQRKGATEEIMRTFSQGGADILIGTQLVAKGLDIANVTLVGVLAADAAFSLPDFRSAERGFQLLTQVAGRAGRGKSTGIVIFQTFNTELPALLFAKEHDYEAFATAELSSRQTLAYPPFSQLIRIVGSSLMPASIQQALHQYAEELSVYMEDNIPPDAVQLLGPAPCLIEKVRNRFRYHLLIKNMAGNSGHALITEHFRKARFPSDCTVTIDIDAVDII